MNDWSLGRFLRGSDRTLPARWKQPAFLPSLNVKTARSWRGIVPFTHLAREGRMTVTIGRRELLAALGGAAAAWPLAARAEQRERVRRIGVFMPGTADDPGYQARNAAFLQALGELGWIVGRNVRIDYRWGAGEVERYGAIGADLISLAPDAVLAEGYATVSALQNATR